LTVIVGGYPIIYHHVQELSKIEAIRNIFFIGNYDPKKFNYFIDDLLSEFSFQSIEFIQDDIPKNEAGVLFKYRNKLLLENP
jgi:mannose-1-phosphate guanylyltransferase